MKKKIAVVFNRMIVGGAEKALLNFLYAIDTERYDVTLFTFNDKGAYFDELPKDITVRFTAYDNAKMQFLDDVKHFRVNRIANGLYCRVMIRLCRDQYKKFSYTLRSYPKLEGHFDCAIAYKMNFEDTATVIWRISAEKKCAWMHSSIIAVKKQTDRFILLLLLLLQRIFCVSNDCKEQLDRVYPVYKYKTQVIHNVFDTNGIVGLAQKPLDKALKQQALITVGRLSPEKGQAMIPQTTRLLLDAGYDVYWYLVGDGSLRGTIEAEIQQYDVADHVILLGTQMNPYPYIKNCDIYVQPSFSEGYCTTTMEAKILRKPIVTTDAPGMREQFVSGENGLIVDAMTPEALFEGIRTLLDHPELQKKFVENLSHEVCDNSGELQKLYDFIES